MCACNMHVYNLCVYICVACCEVSAYILYLMIQIHTHTSPLPNTNIQPNIPRAVFKVSILESFSADDAICVCVLAHELRSHACVCVCVLYCLCCSVNCAPKPAEQVPVSASDSF